MSALAIAEDTVLAVHPAPTPDELARSCLRLAYQRAGVWHRRYPSLDKEEMEGEALLKLAKAAQAFDHKRGCKFITLAHVCIDRHLAQWCGKSLNKHKGRARLFSELDGRRDTEGEGYGSQIPAPERLPPTVRGDAHLGQALTLLPARLRRAVEGRWLQEKSLREMSEELGVTRERCRQLVEAGLRMLHGLLRRLEAGERIPAQTEMF